jgi:hypothetical protein
VALDEIDLDTLGELQARDEPVRLDLREPDRHELDKVADGLALHRLAVEDSRVAVVALTRSPPPTPET